MNRLIALLLIFSLASITWSQEAEEGETLGQPEAEAAAATAASDDEEALEEASELDEQGYGLEEEEDDFIPSQEVSADQSLPFPVDI